MAEMVDPITSLAGVKFQELRQMLGTYCMETRGKEGDLLSGKRRFINELYNMMMRSGEGSPLELRNWLQEIRDKCEGLEAVIDVYLKGASDKPFETFTYHGKSFDVRNVIEAIGKQSALMWKENKETESKREEEKQAYVKSTFPLCLEVLIVYYDRIVKQLRGFELDWNRYLQKYRGNKDCVQLMNIIAHQINFLCGDLPVKPKQYYIENTCPEDCRSMIQSPNSETDWSRAVWCIYLDVKTKGFTGTFNKDVLEQMEHWLSPRRYPMCAELRRYPMCAELLIQMFEKFDLSDVAHAKMLGTFEEYMKNDDSVELLRYCANFINAWTKYGATFFKTKPDIADTIPKEFPFQIMSPDGMTDWTRMVWMIGKTLDYGGSLTADSLSQVETRLEQTVWRMRASVRRKMWQRKKETPSAVKTSTDAAETDARLGRVATWLEKIDKERVSLRVWMDKLDAFCERWEGREFPTEFYENVVDMIFEVRTEVKRNPPDKAWIKRLIHHISTAVDDNGHLFKASVGAKYVLNGKPANIMDTLEHLPDELQEVGAPSSAASPRSRSPVRGFSPFGPASPYEGGSGGSGKQVKISTLLHALQALM